MIAEQTGPDPDTDRFAYSRTALARLALAHEAAYLADRAAEVVPTRHDAWSHAGEGVGRADHHLARHAPPVRALAADQPRLDPDHRQARLGELAGDLLAADSQPDHDNVDLVRHGDSLA